MSKLEYLNPEDWSLHVINGENEAVPEGWLLVPEGSEIYLKNPREGYCFFAKNNGKTLDSFNTLLKNGWYTESTLSFESIHINYNLLWQRESKSEVVEKKHNHYFKDVEHLKEIDVYRVLDLFAVEHPCLQHAAKKLLCAGQRGSKGRDKDIQEAIDSLVRFQEMRKEDNNG